MYNQFCLKVCFGSPMNISFSFCFCKTCNVIKSPLHHILLSVITHKSCSNTLTSINSIFQFKMLKVLILVYFMVCHTALLKKGRGVLSARWNSQSKSPLWVYWFLGYSWSYFTLDSMENRPREKFMLYYDFEYSPRLTKERENRVHLGRRESKCKEVSYHIDHSLPKYC